MIPLKLFQTRNGAGAAPGEALRDTAGGTEGQQGQRDRPSNQSSLGL